MAYRQLNSFDRAQIEILQQEDYSLGEIAKTLKRS
ncbi:MAG: helix-turn-helix domain-containing protein, partial [Kiritimatiellales bacterium]|nr:helix-turn-helix domain-containing protein [Kiritimatiellales bacterium]